MKVLITGGRGWLGSRLAQELADAGGHEVTVIDRCCGDLTDPQIARDLISHVAPEVVIHMAAQVGRLWCDDDPAHAWRSNVVMTENVARAVHCTPARLVYCSTSEVYGDHGSELIGERARCRPSSGSYAETKYVAELACKALAPYNLQIWRPTMPYGPGVPPGRGRASIINVLQAALDREPIVVHRGGARSWCYVQDVVRGMRMVLEQGELGIWNIGRDDNMISMVNLARIACDIAGAPRSLISEEDAPPQQTLVKNLSTAKLRGLGWTPTGDLSTGMTRTFEWLRNHQEELGQGEIRG